MPTEVPLQFDMFNGSLVDTRSASQKRRDHEADQPRQLDMFSQRELAQYIPPPRMSLPATATLMLVMEDPRTEEDKDRDRERAAQTLTAPLFTSDQTTNVVLIDTDTDLFADELVDADSEAGVEGEVETQPTLSKDDERAGALAELERVVTDIGQTIAAAPDMLRAQSLWLALATVEATTAGVSKDEVVAVLQRLDGASPKPYPRANARYGNYPGETSGLLPALIPDLSLQPSLV